jgi:hypothetical protein
LCHIVHAAETPGPVRAALLRDFSGLFAIGGTYLCSTFLPSYKALLEACGFRRIPAAQNRTWGTTYLVDGYVLDLSSIGFERWIEAMVGGSALPTELDASAIESELREVLAHWDDSHWLARSPLVRRFGMEPGPESDRPQRCREMVLSALTEARANSSPDKRLAYHAVELAYLGDGSTRKQAARQLAASRATFYRLVSRGVRGLAQTLARPH